MITFIAILTFAGALGFAAFVMYATVAPALPKITAALTGRAVTSNLPLLPQRRVATLRAMVQPAAQLAYWRAAA